MLAGCLAGSAVLEGGDSTAPGAAVLGVSGSEPEGCEQLGCRLCWRVCSCFFRCWDAEIADIRS